MENLNTTSIIHFSACTTDSALQRRITEKLAELFKGKTTLDRIGYLGCSASIPNANAALEITLFFNPRLGGHPDQVGKNINEDERKVNPILNLLTGYFFISDADSRATFTKMVAPKYHIVEAEDGQGQRFDKIELDYDRKGRKKIGEVTVLAIKCSAKLVMAAITDSSLTDPTFKVEHRPVGRKSEQIMTSFDNKNSMPVEIDVQKNSQNSAKGYNPDDAKAFLIKEREARLSRKSTEKTLHTEAKTKAQKNEKKVNEKLKERSNKYLKKYGG